MLISLMLLLFQWMVFKMLVSLSMETLHFIVSVVVFIVWIWISIFIFFHLGCCCCLCPADAVYNRQYSLWVILYALILHYHYHRFGWVLMNKLSLLIDKQVCIVFITFMVISFLLFLVFPLYYFYKMPSICYSIAQPTLNV